MTFVAMKPTLLSLPTEIQLLIFHALFVDEEQRSMSHPMMRVSKLAHETCKPIILSHLRLHIDAWPDCEEYPDIDDALMNFTLKPSKWSDMDSNDIQKNYSWKDFCAKPELVALLPYVGSLVFHCALERNGCSCCYEECWAIVRWRCGKGEPRVEDRKYGVDCGAIGYVPEAGLEHSEARMRRERAALEVSKASVLSLQVLESFFVDVFAEEPVQGYETEEE